VLVFSAFLSRSMFVRKISYLTWKENGLADFGEIWQAGPPYVIPVRFQNLSPDLFLLVPIDFLQQQPVRDFGSDWSPTTLI